MKRRQFIALLGGAALAPCVSWPLVVRAQQAERIRRVGVLMSGDEREASAQAQLAAFRDALPKLGWSEGRDITLDVRWIGPDDERRRVAATEMVSRAPDVILAHTAPVTIAVKQATTTIPVVFASGSDPVRNGLVTNLARPEGNITGFPANEPSMGGKWLELLRTLVPNATRVGIVEPLENPVLADYWSAAQGAAQGWIADMTRIAVRDSAQINRDVGEFARAGSGVLLVLPGPSTGSVGAAITAAAAQFRVPAVYPFRSYAISGGLMSYGADNVDIFRRAAGYVDRILRGEKPGDLPVQLPTKFELVINLKAAKALGLTVPLSLMVAADEVIE